MNKILSMISMSKKAGKLISGEFLCENALKGKKANLLIIAEDASNNTKEKFHNMCFSKNVDYIIMFKKEELGNAIGGYQRATIAICDKGFAAAINKLIKQVVN